MNIWKVILVMGIVIAPLFRTLPTVAGEKIKLYVVSSYHREYDWSQETNKGLCDAMLKLGYFDNPKQVADYTQNDEVETSKMVLGKSWLDAKRQSSDPEKQAGATTIYKKIREFGPDLIFLGDDDAADYLGRMFLDDAIPVVFWGVNNNPLKYGLVESMERPGHNVTGVYQSGYYRQSIELLQKLCPKVKTIAVLSDDSSTGRSHYKAVEYLARGSGATFELLETVATNDLATWKAKALALQDKVDAFYLAHYASLKDEEGKNVSTGDVAKWYIENIKIPEASGQGQFIRQGILCGADDSAYNQGAEAVLVAHDILAKGMAPATYPPRTPKLGPRMVNKKRAAMLEIKLTNTDIDELVE